MRVRKRRVRRRMSRRGSKMKGDEGGAQVEVEEKEGKLEEEFK